MTSYIKIFGLMAALTALLAGIAGYFGGTNWMVGALVFAALFNVGSYWFSDRAVLRMYRAQPIERDQDPELFDLVDELRRKAGLPMPRLAVVQNDQPNAFATGRDPEHSVVCVTTGIRRALDRDQLAGVLSHELAHVQHRDMLIGTVAATMAAAIVMLARFGFFLGGDRNRGSLGAVGGILMLVLAPLAAMMIQMAISRQNEFRADAGGARITGRPLDLAHALERIDREAERTPMRVNPAAAHLCIVNPLRGGGAAFASLFRTHPPTDERVRRLEALAGGIA
ncbi:MAG: zinc metalloprotease HtpX [Candidatus Palauibacterales bacterium]|nr:zinc metalloprotease HtpX [Candidatus Palauibacterales bacterium]MDP2528252.1 zinc metalloprotease HtpX [Candidatus Palauibacterales bacterium]MDP2584912.1 zinc metalloprotease HtpX [Candidatus Palauibacterales bacterium]